ncbi:MAG: hypothetical protein KatS3mg129_0943 [Leptospiraceae bacterium]|nr:MAG: hypothetical protein KatS3mg129_0943 [Leptospiraceae bacterium]
MEYLKTELKNTIVKKTIQKNNKNYQYLKIILIGSFQNINYFSFEEFIKNELSPISNDYNIIIFELSKLNYINSLGISCLIELIENLYEKQYKVFILNLPSHLKRILYFLEFQNKSIIIHQEEDFIEYL